MEMGRGMGNDGHGRKNIHSKIFIPCPLVNNVNRVNTTPVLLVVSTPSLYQASASGSGRTFGAFGHPFFLAK